jgi:hypothetical protein
VSGLVERDDRVLQRGAGASKAQREPGRLSDTPFDQLARQFYLDVPEAADYLRFPSVAALRKWVAKACVPKFRAGRKVLFARKDLDRAVADPMRPQRKQFHREAV